MSVVQMMLEATRSAAMQTPMTMLRIELKTRLEKSSEDWIEMFIQPWPRRYSFNTSLTRPGSYCPFLPAR